MRLTLATTVLYRYSPSSIELLEKKQTLYARLKSYIEGNKLLFKAQYGFIE